MNSSKLVVIFAIAVLAMAGCIGAAYAFSASLDNTGNSAAIAYWELSISDSSSVVTAESGDVYTNSLNAVTPYDTITRFEGGQEVVYLKWIGTIQEDIIGLQFNPLGFIEVTAVRPVAGSEDQREPVPEPASGKHYVMTLTMHNDSHQVNTKYDYYAGKVTIADHKIDVQATEIYPLLASGTDFIANLPVTGIGTGYAFAVYAMPHNLVDLDSIKDDGSTDVLRGATIEVKVHSDEQSDDPELSKIECIRPMDKMSYLSTDAGWDKTGLSVAATYADGTVKAIGASDLTIDTAFAAGVTEITLSYGGKTCTLSGIEVVEP